MRDIDEIKRTPKLNIIESGEDGMCGTYQDMTFVFSWGGGWEHLSVSHRWHTPSWEEMCRMKNIFFKPEETCVEYHPAKKDYVNNHPFCLHIWRPLNQKLPKPPKIYV